MGKMKAQAKVWLAWMLVGVVIAAAAATRPATFSLAIHTQQATIKAGDALSLTLVMTNTSDKDIRFGQVLNGGRSPFQIHVLDESNHKVPETPYGQQVNGTTPDTMAVGGEFTVEVAPGKSVREEIMLTKAYEINRPGQYTIFVEKYDPLSGVTVKSNVIVLAVQ